MNDEKHEHAGQSGTPGDGQHEAERPGRDSREGWSTRRGFTIGRGGHGISFGISGQAGKHPAGGVQREEATAPGEAPPAKQPAASRLTAISSNKLEMVEDTGEEGWTITITGASRSPASGGPTGPEGPATKTAATRTPEEQAIIDAVARSRGREWAEAYAELILEQARAIGDL